MRSILGPTWLEPPPAPGQHAASWGTVFTFCADWAVGPDGALWWCNQLNGRIERIAYVGPVVSVPAESRTRIPDRAFYDLQGRRVQHTKRDGLYFSGDDRRRVVIH